MNSQEVLDIKKELLLSLLAEMDKGIVSGMTPVKKSSSTLIIAEGSPKKEDESLDELATGDDSNEPCGEVEEDEDSDIQKKLQKLFGSR